MITPDYEAGVRAALDGLFWHENPTGSKDWLDGHDSVTQAMQRGAWFAADVEAKRSARLDVMEAENDRPEINADSIRRRCY